MTLNFLESCKPCAKLQKVNKILRTTLNTSIVDLLLIGLLAQHLNRQRLRIEVNAKVSDIISGGSWLSLSCD